jgi:hypothetical protein
MIHRQASQVKPLKCGTPPEPLSDHVKRFQHEWVNVLRAIAKACPLVAESCRELLRLDPLNTMSDRAVEHHADRIREILSDPVLRPSLERERNRKAFGENVARLRKALGWSRRQLVRECAKAAGRMGFGVRGPDRWQLADCEAGRSNAHPGTKVVIAAALGVTVDELEAVRAAPPLELGSVGFEVPTPERLSANIPAARPYRIDIFAAEDPDGYFSRMRRSRNAA